jgi:hypothetical protein
MTIEKKTYEKPVIYDLGHILTGSAQIPMGYCSGGDSPSEPVTVCQGGSGVQESCPGGNLYSIPQNVCQAGGAAADFCSFGGAFGGCDFGATP